MMSALWYILIGVASGILGGMGMGGGTLLIPLLTILMKLPQKLAAGINLLVFLPLSLVAIYFHIKNKMIKKNELKSVTLPLIIPGLAFAIGSSFLAKYINGRIIAIIFGSFLLIICVWQLILFFTTIFKKN